MFLHEKYLIAHLKNVANYAARFDGLDLPTGWTNGMSDVDVQAYSDTVVKSTPPPVTSAPPVDIAPPVSDIGLPEL